MPDAIKQPQIGSPRFASKIGIGADDELWPIQNRQRFQASPFRAECCMVAAYRSWHTGPRIRDDTIRAAVRCLPPLMG